MASLEEKVAEAYKLLMEDIQNKSQDPNFTISTHTYQDTDQEMQKLRGHLDQSKQESFEIAVNFFKETIKTELATTTSTYERLKKGSSEFPSISTLSMTPIDDPFAFVAICVAIAGMAAITSVYLLGEDIKNIGTELYNQERVESNLKKIAVLTLFAAATVAFVASNPVGWSLGAICVTALIASIVGFGAHHSLSYLDKDLYTLSEKEKKKIGNVNDVSNKLAFVKAKEDAGFISTTEAKNQLKKIKKDAGLMGLADKNSNTTQIKPAR
jgi:hypothetical protein